MCSSDLQKQKGVIAVSTGNHGKGVAYAASVLGIKSTIYMSSMVPQHRKEAIEALGAKVEIIGNNSDEADFIIANGTSCRHQISDLSHKKGKHVSELLFKIFETVN